MKSLVSVIVPVYNTGSVAIPLLKSLLSSSYQDLELICIDDGSTDDSYQKIKSNIKDPRFKLIKQKNGGPSSARNAGINISSGEYLFFVDSDDQVSPNFLTELTKAVSTPDIDLAICGVYFHTVSTNSTYKTQIKLLKKQGSFESKAAYILRLLLSDGRMYNVTNKVFKSEIVRAHNLRFDESINFAEDLKFVLEYLKYASGDIKFVKKPLYTYNFGTPTSVIKKSAISRINWQTSFNHLRRWAKAVSRPSLRANFRLGLIWLRWQFSHNKAVLSSNLTRSQKLRAGSPLFLIPTTIAFRLIDFIRHLRHPRVK